MINLPRGHSIASFITKPQMPHVYVDGVPWAIDAMMSTSRWPRKRSRYSLSQT